MDVIPVILKTLLPPSNESIITSDLSPSQVALLQLHNSLLKKYQPQGKNQNADKAALDLFIESNEQCKLWEPDEQSYYFDIMLDARCRLHRRFYGGELQAPVISLNKAMDRLRPGPGSSQGTKHTDFLRKLFHSELTTYDSSLWQYYRESLPTLWKLAEKVRQRQYGSATTVTASKLTFAKKNFDISRVINTEANLDMLFQLGIGSLMEDCLKDWFNIDLSQQPTINRFLARLGSIYSSHATIDLKSASDLNSDNFMKWFLPPVMYKTLDTVRAKCIELPNGNMYKLGTFSTMGNGFTFPLQTIVFASIVEAAYHSMSIPIDNNGQVPAFSVFGDDIICVERAYSKVIGALEWCGFRVNKDKSFNTGSFRESCGQDFFKGHDVRGVYIKKFYHETHYYSIFNRLTRWSIRNCIDLGNILRHLKGLALFRPVPFDEQDIAGIKCSLSMSSLRSNCRGAIRYKCLRIRPNRKSTKDYETNPAAVELAAVGCFIGGTASQSGVTTGILANDSVFRPFKDGKPVGAFTIRSNPDGVPNVKAVRASTPSWDFVPHKGLTILDYDIVLADVIC